MANRRFGNKDTGIPGLERFTGRYYNGKPLYRKLVSVGALPNAGTAATAHGITGLDEVESVTGAAENTLGQSIPIPG
jgi:hypothetical protein